jgi:hypothetical protein
MSKSKYSDLSLQLTKILSKNEKKTQGIYFTPPPTIKKNIEYISQYIEKDIRVLEPSCGSGEYISALNTLNRFNITAIEKNKTIYDSILGLSATNIDIINADYLSYTNENKFDLIIGNPPYFVMKKREVDTEYYKYFTGRPNIFILFIIKSLNMLKENGILSFVLPKNFLNCLYYNHTREYINKTCTILHILECNDDYIETKQETIVLIIRKNSQSMLGPEIDTEVAPKVDTEVAPKVAPEVAPKVDTNVNSAYNLKINEYLIFGTEETIVELKKLYSNSKSLHDIGFKVNVGNVVWNQCKDILTDECKTRLIYSSDIVDKKLILKKYKNECKKNYIDKKGEKDMVLVVNRGYGVGNYKFEYCLIDCDFEYLIENHLIVIRHIDVENDKPIGKEQLLLKYNSIINSLSNEKTKKFIELYFGNNAINTVELNHILPIY